MKERSRQNGLGILSGMTKGLVNDLLGCIEETRTEFLITLSTDSPSGIMNMVPNRESSSGERRER